MEPIYDQIGVNYAQKRKSDPRIFSQIRSHLTEANKIVNIGAGSGSYEPSEMNLIAIEPSWEMINQRKPDAHPVLQGTAESLPLPDNSCTHALTILSMHHWVDRSLAFEEINRVATDKFVAVSWNPNSDPFWLTRDYFPEIYDIDKEIFPSLDEIQDSFDELKVEPLLIPEDCEDGFLAAYWKRPYAYLNESVRSSISSFSKISNISKGLDKLRSDLETKKWQERNKSILFDSMMDTGYVIISGKIRKIV